jgi:hypothetical protein
MIRSIYNNIVEHVAFNIFSEERENIIEYIHEKSELEDEEDLSVAWIYSKLSEYLENYNLVDNINNVIECNLLHQNDGMEIISDVGIEDALKIYVDLYGEINETHIPTENEIVKSVLKVIYYPKIDDIVVKLMNLISIKL